VVIALFGCAGHPFATVPAPQILGACGAKPTFAESTVLKRWERFPVDVFVDTGSLPEAQSETYLEGIERGVRLWAEATGGKIGDFEVNDDKPESPVRISIAKDPLPDDAIGSTELTFTLNRIVSAEVLITRSRFEGTAYLSHDVASTTAHEMGHVLGIVDHSPHPEDKMWASGNFSGENREREPSSLITPRDVNTVEEAYCRP
jgi:predicted Zn-dependent protease